ncbi:MAG: hypothetical protein A3I66_20225 [Burkholderiales bacterium RIFCSPLOWO2_02_FULL_57_36]|nr:MAG: hypothetical protein A3I66_20225 [Burkholderiales bacterium RIFCSPLOWO2_02_FULL_57_36]
MAKILITGGVGLIGSYLIESLAQSSHSITVIDDLSRGRKEYLPEGCKHIKACIENINALELGRFDIVIHLASFMFGIGFANKNHQRLYVQNIRMNNSMIQYIAENTPDRFIFVSSSCVYPDDGPDVIVEETPLGHFPELANIGYGFAKRHMEDCLRMEAMLHGFELCIMRPFNIYGERYHWAGDLSQAIPMLVNKVMTQQRVDVWGSGLQRRNYVHASDAAEIIRLVSLSRTHIPLLNIGNERTVTLNLLTQKIGRAAGLDIEIHNDITKPEGRFVKSCEDGLMHQHFPEFQYSVPLDEGLLRMIDWWRREMHDFYESAERH